MISNVLRNFIVYVDGEGKLGDGHKCQLPNIVEKTEEFLGGGMPAPLEMGLAFEALTASFAMTSLDRQVKNKIGIHPPRQWNFTARGYMESSNGDTSSVIANMRGRIKSSDLGEWEVGSEVENTFELTLVRYRLRIGGNEIYKINIETPEWVVNGQDQLAAMRRALGRAL